MAFAKKTWKDRIAEFPTRRRLTKEDNTSELVTVAREEGTLSQKGDAFSAENMNDLENRIDEEFTAVNGKLTWTDWQKLLTDQPQISIYYRYNSITTEIKVENGTYTTPSTSLEIKIAQLPLNLCPLQTIYLVGTEELQLRIETGGLLKIKCHNIYGRGFISYGNRITN